MDTQRSLPAPTVSTDLERVHRPYVDVYGRRAPVADTSQQGDWQRYITAASRHKWVVIFITLAGTLAGFVGASLTEPRYSAKAVLWIEESLRGGGDDGTRSDHIVEAASWADLVTSFSILDEVVRRLTLNVQPLSTADADAFAGFVAAEEVTPGEYQLEVDDRGQTFTLSTREGTTLQTGNVGDSIGPVLGFKWAPTHEVLHPGREIEFDAVTRYDAAQRLAKALKVRLDPGGSFVRLELRGTNPALTTATVNALVEHVPVVAAKLKREKFTELAGILGQQHNSAQQRLAGAEARLASFRQQNAGKLVGWSGGGTMAGEGRTNPRMAPYVDLQLANEQLGRDRQAIEDVLRTNGQGLNVEALEAIGAVRESRPLTDALEEATRQRAALRVLRNRYTDESRDVVVARAALDTLEGRTIPALARQLAGTLTARQGTIRPRVDSAMRVLRAVPTLEIDESRLMRGVSSAEELAAAVASRYEAAKLGVVSAQPDVRVLDKAALPRKPVSDFAPLIVVLSFFTSLGLAVVGVTVRDKVDSKIRYPEQVTREMRLPILGAIPHVGWKEVPGMGEASAEAIEALRGLRMRVIHAHGVASPILLTITSPSSGEGKSFVSVNLALSFAYAGYRTLLIDGDVRRGAQHQVLDAAGAPGLTDVLSGQMRVEDALQPTSFRGLSFLSSGTRMESAPELLHSPQLGAAMAQLRATYDVVIVDSPPLVAGVDPLVLATMTGNLLLVIRSSTTDLGLAQAKLEVADSLPVRTIGAVLNDVRSRGPFRHYGYDLTDYNQLEDPIISARRDSWRNVLTGRS